MSNNWLIRIGCFGAGFGLGGIVAIFLDAALR